jgi:competence protein ComEC
MNWAAFPYLRVAMVLIIGIIAGELTDVGTYLIFSLTGVLLLLYILIYMIGLPVLFKGKFQSINVLLFVLFMGWSLTAVKKNQIQTALSPEEIDREIYFTGVIDEPPVLKNRLRTFIKVSQKGLTPDLMIPCNLKLLVYFNSNDSSALTYSEGSLINFKGKLREVKSGTNPEAYDYSKYLRYRSVIHQLTVNSGQHFLIKNDGLSWYRNLAANMRLRCLNILRSNIQGTKELAVAQALLLGYRNLISDDLYQDFTDSGAVHVLAVSGLHVAIMIAFFVFLFDKIKSGHLAWKILKVISLTAIVWFYVLMTGSSPAVMRAGLMVTIFILGKYGAEETNIYNILSMAAILLLIFDPFLLFQASFQFSFLALASIVYFQPYIQKLWQPSNKLLHHVWNLVSVAIAAQILVFPVTIYYFHKFPTYFMLTGLVAIPLVYIILYLGLAMLVLDVVFPFANVFINPLFNVILTFFVEIIASIRTLPYSSIKGMWIDEHDFILMYAAVFGLMFFLRDRQILWFSTILSIFFIFYLSYLISDVTKTSQMKIFFYDVYGGILVDFFDGKTCYTLKSSTIDAKTEEFAAYNNRIKHRINEIRYISDEYEFSMNNFKKFRNCCRLGGKSICIYSPSEYNVLDHSLYQPDIIYFSGDLRQNLKDDTLFPEGKTYIINRSVRPWKKEKLKQKLGKDSTGIHDIYKSGAILINVN